jgi:hypothetical protein
MVVGRVTALGAAIVAAMMFDAGVRSDVNRPSDVRASLATSQLARQLNPLLNERVSPDDVATGFQTAEDFAATVHASRNIRVPFTALKHQVVDEGKTLAAAIHAMKPTANASLEADLARSEARADLAAIK